MLENVAVERDAHIFHSKNILAMRIPQEENHHEEVKKTATLGKLHLIPTRF